MSNKTGLLLLVLMVVGLILGILGGFYFPQIMLQLRPLGFLFLNALRLVAIPLVMVSIIIAIASLGDISKLTRGASLKLAYFLVIGGLAAVLGGVASSLLKPGATVAAEFSGDSVGVADIVTNLIPPNIFQSVIMGQTFGLIFVSVIFGAVLSILGSAARPVADFIDALRKILRKLMGFLSFAAPLGLFGLVGVITARNQDWMTSFLPALGIFAAIVVGVLLIHGLIVAPLGMIIWGRKHPFGYFADIQHTLAASFISGSSQPQLQVVTDSAAGRTRAAQPLGPLTLPRGEIFNLDGTAIFQAAAVIFLSQIYGMQLTVAQQLVIVIMSLFVSMAAAGIPHAGVMLLPVILAWAGIPVEGIAFLLAIDWIMDRLRTPLNVWSDMIGSMIIKGVVESKVAPRPAARVAAPDSRDSRPDSRPARFDRPQRSDRFDRRPDGPRRQDYGKRPGGRGEGRGEGRPEQRGGGRGDVRRSGPPRERKPEQKEQRERPEREPSIPKATIERDLEKIRKQLGQQSTEPPATDETTPTPEQPPAKDFFGGEFPKIVFFPDREKETAASEEKPRPESSEPPTEERNFPLEWPDGDREANMAAESVKEEEKERETRPDEAPPEEEDSWGRGRRKHPQK